MRGNHRPCDDGRNPVGVARAFTHETQGSANPGLKYRTPLALKDTKPKGLVELSPGLEQPWVCGETTIYVSSGNPNGVASNAGIPLTWNAVASITA